MRMPKMNGIELELAGEDAAVVEAVLAVVGEEGGARLRWVVTPQIGRGVLLLGVAGTP